MNAMDEAHVQYLIDRAVWTLVDRLAEHAAKMACRVHDAEYALKRADRRIGELERQVKSLRGDVCDMAWETRR